MRGRVARDAANLVTGVRVVLSPLFAWAVVRADASVGWGFVAAGCFGLAAASDVLDGWVARRTGGSSARGRWYDNLADIGFLVPGLGAYVGLGIVPWWVPAAITAAFGYYLIDSRRRPEGGRRALVRSRLGHLGGIGNYILLGVLVGNESLRLHLLPAAVADAFYWTVLGYSVAAVLDRATVRWLGGTAVVPFAE